MNQRKQDSFLYEQVATDLADLIRLGTFRAGERIPSVRQMSRQRKISITTVLQAYMLLENQGFNRDTPAIGILCEIKPATAVARTGDVYPTAGPNTGQCAGIGDDGA